MVLLGPGGCSINIYTYPWRCVMPGTDKGPQSMVSNNQLVNSDILTGWMPPMANVISQDMDERTQEKDNGVARCRAFLWPS